MLPATLRLFFQNILKKIFQILRSQVSFQIYLIMPWKAANSIASIIHKMILFLFICPQITDQDVYDPNEKL